MKHYAIPFFVGAMLMATQAGAGKRIKRTETSARPAAAQAAQLGGRSARTQLGSPRKSRLTMKLSGPITSAALAKRLGNTPKDKLPELRITLTGASARDIQEMLDNGVDFAVTDAVNESAAISAWSDGVLPAAGYDLGDAHLIHKGTRENPSYIAVIPTPKPPVPWEIFD